MADISALLQKLEAAARGAARHSYSPYSSFPVGAAVLTENGKIYSGCNVENASFGLTLCAERVALFSAVAAGLRNFKILLLYTPTPRPCLPCGACRQVLREFVQDVRVIGLCDGPERLDMTLDILLPHAFEPSALHLREQAP